MRALALLCALFLTTDAAAREPVRAERQMAVAAHPAAAEAGRAVLRRGGSAADAAVAIQAMLAVVEPQGSGLAGGTVVLHLDAATGAIAVYEGLAAAPAAFPKELYRDDDGNDLPRGDVRHGGRPIGVPGTLRALEMLHAAHGRLPWAELFTDAARTAEAGFDVPPYMASSLRRSQKSICARPDMRALFCRDRRTAKREGDRIVNPALAATLRAVAAGGADALYRGPIAETIVAAVRDGQPMPGFLSAGDLANYRAVRREPVCGTAFGHRLCSSPPPLHGGVAMLQLVGLAERRGIGALTPNSPAAAHLFIEASRLVNVDRRRHVGDPAFVDVPLTGLLAPAYLDVRAALIDLDRAAKRPEPGAPPGGDRTSHAGIVDANGNAVAMTTTNNLTFGSRVVAAGMVLNNAMINFTSTRPYRGAPPRNAAAPGKRPRSAMSPTLGFDAAGRLRLVAGAAGGSYIVDYVAQAVIGVLAWGQDAQTAVGQPRYGGQRDVSLEKGSAAADLEGPLRDRGHRKIKVQRMTSGAQVIVRDADGTLWGGADPRRDGAVRGD